MPLEAFHVITGLPRSGSTLMCDLLNQRSDLWASSTSALPTTLRNISKVLTESQEVTSDLVGRPGAHERHLNVMRSVLATWHGEPAPVIFDKSRAWTYCAPMLRAIVPESVMVVMVRDPRDVFASIERSHMSSGLYGEGTQGERAKAQLAPDGLIGSAIIGVEDVIRRRPGGVVFVPYDTLVSDTQNTMNAISDVAQLEHFEHDLEAVQSTAYDLDAQWRFKFPHRYVGERPVHANNQHWSDILGVDIANFIAEAWPLYMEYFEFSTKQPQENNQSTLF